MHQRRLRRERRRPLAFAIRRLRRRLPGGGQRARERPARPARDGIPVEPGHIASGLSAYVAKDGGKHWLASAWQYLTGRQLEFNDLGYLERKNDYQGNFALTYRTLDPWWRTLQTRSWL